MRNPERDLNELDADQGIGTETLGSYGETLDVPPLLARGVRTDSLQLDSRAAAEADSGGGGGAPAGVPVDAPGWSNRVLDLVPEGLDRWHRYGGVSFAGVAVAQFWVEFVLWETLLNEQEYTGIIELGTLDGGFSLYLASQAHYRGMSFRTYDIHTPKRDIPGFSKIDIYAHAEEIGQHMRSRDPVIVFCDGGNKPRELRTFSRYVTAESTLVVHDWGTEMLRSDVPDNVEMVHEEWCVELGSASRCFRVRA